MHVKLFPAKNDFFKVYAQHFYKERSSSHIRVKLHMLEAMKKSCDMRERERERGRNMHWRHS